MFMLLHMQRGSSDMIFDTSFLVDLLRSSDLAVQKKAEELDAMLIQKAVTSITVLELWRGALRCGKTEQEKKKIDLLLRSFVVYSIDPEIAKKAAEIETYLLEKGEMVELEDILIAATALVKNMPLLTRNVKHFQRIKGLQVEEY